MRDVQKITDEHIQKGQKVVRGAPQLCVCLFTINPCQSRKSTWNIDTTLDQTFWARKMDGLVVRLPNVWVQFYPIFWPIHMSPTLEGSMTWTVAKIVVEPPSCARYQKQSNEACLSTTLITVNLTKMEVVVRFNYHMFLHPKWDIDQQQLHSHEQPWIMWRSLRFQPLRPCTW